ncbi:hypothetical protein [Persicobacter psychrovividus]|uniref:Transporter n=1 Tax=Persicobacter psychrovividus TaxID=387638 RepID=A0ABN6LFC1_9BACT|nr:hypothetical protein PEPS_41550 [Persicobacter psychrovividus]
MNLSTIKFNKLLRGGFFLLTALLLSMPAMAQEEAAESQDNDEERIAKELANPNTTLGTFAVPIDFIQYSGTLNGANQQFGVVANFQPSLPIPLSPGLNLFVRPLIPLVISQPIYGDGGFEQKGVNLGNISADIAIGKTWPSKTITIAGVFGGFPTATDEQLRSKFTTMGPEFMVAQIFKWGVAGVMINHAWSLNTLDPVEATQMGMHSPLNMGLAMSAGMGSPMLPASMNGERASITAGQYFYTVNLKNGWQIQGQPTFAYNHNGAKGSRLTLPVGTGVNKVTRIGKMPIRLSVQYWHYVAAPEGFGPKGQIRFQIAPVIPLPW